MPRAPTYTLVVRSYGHGSSCCASFSTIAACAPCTATSNGLRSLVFFASARLLTSVSFFTSVSTVLLVGLRCSGACRQVLSEFGDMDVYCVQPDGKVSRSRLSQLLPVAFSKAELDKVAAARG